MTSPGLQSGVPVCPQAPMPLSPQALATDSFLLFSGGNPAAAARGFEPFD